MIVENLPRIRVRITSERVSPGHLRLYRAGVFLGTVKRSGEKWYTKPERVPNSAHWCDSFVAAALYLARFRMYLGSEQDHGDGWHMHRANTGAGWFTVLTKNGTRMVFMDYPLALSDEPDPYTVASAKQVVSKFTCKI